MIFLPGFPYPKVTAKIRDMLFVNGLEKRLGRSLTREEVEIEEFDGYVELFFRDIWGWEKVRIPRLDFPEELTSRPGL